jgi:lipoate-protein ligase B
MQYTSDHSKLIRELSDCDKTQPVFITAGIIPYNQALDLQKGLRTARTENRIPDTIVILEHEPVITVGVRKDRTEITTDAEQLAELGIELVPINRGGGATAHNPGQLVIYPVIGLAARGLRVVPFVHGLEQICIDLLAQYGVEAYTKKRYPGVWVNEQKIASLGIEVVRGVTMHGIACNIANDLSIFSHMVPCGIDGVVMTSLEGQLGEPVDMEDCRKRAQRIVGRFFADWPHKRGSHE